MIHIVLLLIHGTVDIDVHRYLHRGMSQNLRQGFAVQPLLNPLGCKGVAQGMDADRLNPAPPEEILNLR